MKISLFLRTTRYRRQSRGSDYSIQISRFSTNVSSRMEKVLLLTMMYLDSMRLGTDRFDELYVGYEQDDSVPRKTIGEQELILDLLKERQRLVVSIS